MSGIVARTVEAVKVENSSGEKRPLKISDLQSLMVNAIGTVNLELEGIPSSADTDDVTLVEGDLVLLVAQTNEKQNGPWLVHATEPWERPVSFGPEGTVTPQTVTALDGILYGFHMFICKTAEVLIGTTNQKWELLRSTGDIEINLGNVSGNVLIDPTKADVFACVMTGNTVFKIEGNPKRPKPVLLLISQDATGGHKFTIEDATELPIPWANGEPGWNEAAHGRNIVSLFIRLEGSDVIGDGGTQGIQGPVGEKGEKGEKGIKGLGSEEPMKFENCSGINSNISHFGAPYNEHPLRAALLANGLVFLNGIFNMTGEVLAGEKIAKLPNSGMFPATQQILMIRDCEHENWERRVVIKINGEITALDSIRSVDALFWNDSYPVA